MIDKKKLKDIAENIGAVAIAVIVISVFGLAIHSCVDGINDSVNRIEKNQIGSLISQVIKKLEIDRNYRPKILLFLAYGDLEQKDIDGLAEFGYIIKNIPKYSIWRKKRNYIFERNKKL
jgi:hypothetical protein